MELKILKGQPDFDFIERIIKFDKTNMKSVLDAAGIDFSESNRRKDFETNPTFIVAFNEDEIVRLYRKIGFKFEQNTKNSASWRLTADRNILQTSPIISLLEKWKGKHL